MQRQFMVLAFWGANALVGRDLFILIFFFFFFHRPSATLHREGQQQVGTVGKQGNCKGVRCIGALWDVRETYVVLEPGG